MSDTVTRSNGHQKFKRSRAKRFSAFRRKIMNSRFKLFALSAFGALLGLSVLLGGPAFGADPAAAIERKIEAATTKSDHEELAANYEQEA